MAYTSIFSGGNPFLGGKPNPFEGQFIPGKYAAINQQIAIQNPKKAPVYNPKQSFMSKVSQSLANIVTPASKGQAVADKSLANAQDQLLKTIKDPNIPAEHKQRAYQAFVSSYDPNEAAINTKQIQAQASLAGQGKKVVGTGVNLAKGIYNTPKALVRGVVYGLEGQKLLEAQKKNAAATEADKLNTVKLFQQGKISKETLQKAIDSNNVTNTAADVADAANKRKIIASGLTTAASIGLPGLEGVLGRLGGLGKVGLNTAVGAGFGVGNAASGDDFTKKGIAKQALIGGLIGGGVSALGESLSALRARQAAAARVKANNADVATIDNPEALDKLAQQKLLNAVNDTTKSIKQTVGERGGVFGKAATEPAKVARALTKSQSMVNSIDERLAAIDRGEISATPAERRDLFTSRKMLSANADVENPSLTAAVKARKPVETAPDYTKQVEETLNNVKMGSKTNNVKGSVNELESLVRPGRGTRGIQNDLRAATGNLALKVAQERQAAATSVKTFAKNAPGDNLNFIQKIESGVKQSTPELDKAAQQFRTQFDQDYELAKTLKPNLPYLDNYFSQSGLWKDPNAADAFAKKFQSLGGSPGALEKRSYPTIYDGVKAGLELKESNPAVIALNNRTSLLKAKMAQDFLEEQSTKGIDPAVSQRVVDRYLQPGLEGSDLYKTAKSAAYALNSLQLALSGFHVTGTGLNAIFSEFANGLQEVLHGRGLTGAKDIAGSVTAPIKYVLNGRQIIKDFNAGNITKDIQNIAEGGGRIGKQVDFEATGLAKSLQQFKSGSLKEGVKGATFAIPRAFNDAAKPIMEWWVPRIKAGATKALIDRKLAELGPNASEAAQRAAKATVIDSIDNRFGQLTQDNLFWNNKLKDASKVLMRSPGWNIGTVREIGGGGLDLLKPSTYKGLAKGQGISERSAYTLSLAAGTMLIGTALNYLYTGKAPSSPIDYFYPKTGKIDKNGNDERVSLPTYTKDIFAFTHNPVQTVSNKANPLLSLGSNVATNKDYFGNQVRNPDDSLGTQAKQVGSFLGKNLLPFSVTNGNQRTDKGTGARLQSFAGVTPAPSYITKSPFEQKVQQALNTALGSKPQTPEEQGLTNAKSQAKQSAAKGDNSRIDQLVASGQLTKAQGDSLETASKSTSLANQFSYLMSVDRPAAAKLIKGASPGDLKKLGDPNQLIKALNKTLKNKNSKQSTKDASSKLIQVLSK